MNRILSLIKATMTEDMNLFRISTKKKSFFNQIALPIIITLLIMGSIYYYSETFFVEFERVNMGYVLLSIFVMITSIITIIEGIYKSGNLLFNCKDDNLLFSFPIKKSTILFLRIFKFYMFELLYNSLFLVPAIVVYAIHIHPDVTYYIVSFICLLLFPIIPIIISCIIGAITTFFSSRFKRKNYVQTIITIVFLLGILYFSYNFNNLIRDIAENATSINDLITKLYYPAGAYIELITCFSIKKLFEFILVHICIFILMIAVIGKIYFKINSSVKNVKINKHNKNYKVKTSKPMKALIRKEFNRFINSTVFVSNAGFGLVLFVIGCIFISIRFDSIAPIIGNALNFSLDHINSYIPVILFALIIFASLMTSITSSMISLEGKSFNILKSLPLKPYTIVQSKILTAILVMVPCILIGDIIMLIRFATMFNILSIILILIASIIFPLVSETIGIIINLKYPRMDAKNDTEVVKQSMSSSICVFLGMLLLGVTMFLLYMTIQAQISTNIIMLIFTGAYSIIYIGLNILLYKTSEKNFRNIIV